MLGSGTVDPLPERACSGYYLECQGEALILDLGNGALRKAVGLGLPIHRCRSLFLSHLHPDHTADLVPYLFARNYAPPPWNESESLTLYGPPGTAQFLEAVLAAWPSISPKEGKPGVSVHEYREGEEIALSNRVTVRPYPVEHGDMKAYAIRVEDHKTCFVYSGDTRLCEGIVEAAFRANFFLCECSCFPRGCEPLYCREVHLSWEDVQEICQRAHCQEVAITHLYRPVLESKPSPLESLRAGLAIPVHQAEDGHSYQVEANGSSEDP